MVERRHVQIPVPVDRRRPSTVLLDSRVIELYRAGLPRKIIAHKLQMSYSTVASSIQRFLAVTLSRCPFCGNQKNGTSS